MLNATTTARIMEIIIFILCSCASSSSIFFTCAQAAVTVDAKINTVHKNRTTCTLNLRAQQRLQYALRMRNLPDARFKTADVKLIMTNIVNFTKNDLI